MQLRGHLLGLLDSTCAFLRQRLVAGSLLLREDQRCLGQIQLRRAGADLRLLHRYLSVDALHARLRLLHRCLGLIDGDRIVHRVDHRKQITLVNVFVVPDGHRDDPAGDLRRHRDHIGTHGRVARPRSPHIGFPHPPTEQPRERHRRQGEQERDDPHARAFRAFGRAGHGLRRPERTGIIGRLAALWGDFSDGHDELRETMRIQDERTMM